MDVDNAGDISEVCAAFTARLKMCRMGDFCIQIYVLKN
jgi:hypothetical protein